MRLIAINVAATLATGVISPATADCTCRGPGIIAHHGETVCLRTPAGPRLARCEMVLNNSSWTFLSDPCPEASLDHSDETAAAMSVAPPGHTFVE